MNTIRIQHDNIYTETTRIKSHVSDDIVKMMEIKYRDIQSQLDLVDGATNAALKDVMAQNRLKTIEAAGVLDKLCGFISDAAQQVEVTDQRIARAITSGQSGIRGER